MAGGQIEWQDQNKNPTMTVDEARRTFRDVVLGLEYRTPFFIYFSLSNVSLPPARLSQLTRSFSHVMQCTTKELSTGTSSPPISSGPKIIPSLRYQILGYLMSLKPYYALRRVEELQKTTKLFERQPVVLPFSLQSFVTPPIILQELQIPSRHRGGRTLGITSPQRTAVPQESIRVGDQIILDIRRLLPPMQLVLRITSSHILSCHLLR